MKKAKQSAFLDAVFLIDFGNSLMKRMIPHCIKFSRSEARRTFLDMNPNLIPHDIKFSGSDATPQEIFCAIEITPQEIFETFDAAEYEDALKRTRKLVAEREEMDNEINKYKQKFFENNPGFSKETYESAKEQNSLFFSLQWGGGQSSAFRLSYDLINREKTYIKAIDMASQDAMLEFLLYSKKTHFHYGEILKLSPQEISDAFEKSFYVPYALERAEKLLHDGYDVTQSKYRKPPIPYEEAFQWFRRNNPGFSDESYERALKYCQDDIISRNSPNG